MSTAAPAGGLHVLWLDVFADRPFEGNPLAVVLDADALDDRTMGSLAAEVGGAPGRPSDVRVGGHAVLVLEAVLDRGAMG